MCQVSVRRSGPVARIPTFFAKCGLYRVSVRRSGPVARILPSLQTIVKTELRWQYSTNLSNRHAPSPSSAKVSGFYQITAEISSMSSPPSLDAEQERRGPLFDQVASVVVLSRAWDKVRANAGASGGDNVTIERFAATADQRIRRLAHDLRCGRYVPGPFRRVYIPKDSGGFRQLDIPCVADRIVQAAAALVLDPILDAEMESSSFAYRRGKSVAQAVARVAALRRAGFTHVVDGDIRSYFENIPHEPLILRLERSVDDPVLVDLIWLWLEAFSPAGKGVPQGSPISPLLANLYLDEIDEIVEGKGVHLVRFADDFVLLCRSELAAGRALESMRKLLASHGLDLNPEKTKIVDFERGFRFLGHVFVRSMIWKEVGEDETPAEDVVAAAEAFTKAATEKEEEPEEEEPGSSRHSPRLRPLYVLEPGRRLEARGQTLVVSEDGKDLLHLPAGRLGRIELGPGVDASLSALDLALGYGVEVVRIDGHGGVCARYEGPAEDRARRHLDQARHALDEEKRLGFARLIVEGRIRNQRALLRRLNRRRKAPEIAEACVRMARILRRLENASSVSECLGFEGEAAAIYWPALGHALPEGMAFKFRRRRPAPDPVNALLSIMSGLLARDIRSMAQRAGLHVGFGVLHAAEEGEEALVYDLMEEFRAPIAEAASLALINRGAIKPEMFIPSGDGVRLDRAAWAATIRGYEAWVSRPILSPRSQHKVLWRGLLYEQAQAYAAHCEGRETYRPYLLDH